MLISRRSDEDAIIRDARAEIVRLRGEVEQARKSCQEMVNQSYKDGFADGIAPAEAKGEAVAWRNPTPYGVGYSFASEEVMRDLVGYVAESFDTPQPAGGEAVAPFLWLRMKPDGTPDWAEDCVGQDEHFLDSELKSDGYWLKALYDTTPPAAQVQGEDFVHHEYTRGYSDAVKAAQVQQEAVELTVCCGRQECGGECGNEWRGTEWVRKVTHPAADALGAVRELVGKWLREIPTRDECFGDREASASAGVYSKLIDELEAAIAQAPAVRVTAEDLRWCEDIHADLIEAGGPTNNMRAVGLRRLIAALEAALGQGKGS